MLVLAAITFNICIWNRINLLVWTSRYDSMISPFYDLPICEKCGCQNTGHSFVPKKLPLRLLDWFISHQVPETTPVSALNWPVDSPLVEKTIWSTPLSVTVPEPVPAPPIPTNVWVAVPWSVTCIVHGPSWSPSKVPFQIHSKAVVSGAAGQLSSLLLQDRNKSVRKDPVMNRVFMIVSI